MSTAFSEAVSKSLIERMKRPSNQVGENQGEFVCCGPKFLISQQRKTAYTNERHALERRCQRSECGFHRNPFAALAYRTNSKVGRVVDSAICARETVKSL